MLSLHIGRCDISISVALMFSFAADQLGFEHTMYAGVEGDTIAVCVVVGYGILDNDLTIPIIILPSSTATGIYVYFERCYP